MHAITLCSLQALESDQTKRDQCRPIRWNQSKPELHIIAVK